MMSWITYGYGAFLLICYYAGYFLFLKRRNRISPKQGSSEKIDPNDVSVVVPFRNESKNLKLLIDSILKLRQKPGELIFVNDHSTDDFLSEFKRLENQVSYQLLSLSENEAGKKKALRTGFRQAKGTFILTWDADVRVPESYFEQLSACEERDLWILPVKMPGKNLQEQLFELDYYFINALNVPMTGYHQPILASGANLLFRKKCFETDDRSEKHLHISSGDDLFLLADFKHAKRNIDLRLDSELQLETDAPASVTEFVHQRVRWAGKTLQVKDFSANLLAFFGLLYHFSFWVLFFLTVFDPLVLLIKTAFDLLFILPYLYRLKRLFLAAYVPVFSLVYPFYVFSIAVLSLFVKAKWKGRIVN